MRRLTFLLFILAACGSATETVPDRYNFGIVDGANQVSTAGTPTLEKKITAQLTRDPQGEFAWVDFLLPTKAYAQGLTLTGTPVAGAIVCGREAAAGEPQVIPLCAFTGADGKAVNTVKPGTKAGTFKILFTAQVTAQEPVQDSTSVTVNAGAMASHSFRTGTTFGCWTVFPALNVRDQYGNPVPYRFTTTGTLAHVGSIVFGDVQARTFIADRQSAVLPPVPPARDNYFEFQAVSVETAVGVIATGKITVPNLSAACIDLSL